MPTDNIENNGNTNQRQAENTAPSLIDRIRINGVYLHRNSGKFYLVTSVEETETDKIVHYRRFVDDVTYSQPISVFPRRLRPANREERRLLISTISHFSEIEVVPTLDLINEYLESLSREDTTDNEEGDNSVQQEEPSGEEASDVGILIEPDLRYSWDRVVLKEETRRDIEIGVRSITRRGRINELFHLDRLQENINRSILNFHGVPGTGKTLAARCIATELGKKLYQVDYSSIISKYLGDTAKHIKAAFYHARINNAILFFDEGDSLLSRRINTSHDHSTSINQNRNVLMQELDRFDGIVLISTNLFKNYDPAIVRRINRHIQFELPDNEMKIELLKVHLCEDRCREIDYELVSRAMNNFSGGDIKNVVMNSIETVCMADDENEWFIDTDVLISESVKIRDSKDENNGKGRNRSRYSNVRYK